MYPPRSQERRLRRSNKVPSLQLQPALLYSFPYHPGGTRDLMIFQVEKSQSESVKWARHRNALQLIGKMLEGNLLRAGMHVIQSIQTIPTCYSGYPETRKTTMVPAGFFLVLLEVCKIGRVTYSRQFLNNCCKLFHLFSTGMIRDFLGAKVSMRTSHRSSSTQRKPGYQTLFY